MKILIELPTWLGDTVMTTPAIENLISYYDDLEITIIGSFVSIELMKHHPNVVEFNVVEKNYLSLINLAINLGSFDAFFSFRGSIRSKILKLLISSNNKFQFKKKKYQNRHQVEKYNDFINDSLKTHYEASYLKIYHKSQKYKKTSPILGINPGATFGEAKRWYPEKFAKVCEKLSEKYNILIFGGRNEVSFASDIEKILIKKGISNYINLAGQTSVNELIDHISNLDLFITGDSGPMHIAAGFQIPTISIFGPTRDKETAQWMSSKNVILKKNLSCQPCMKRICPLKHHDCMRLIKTKDVLNAVQLFN